MREITDEIKQEIRSMVYDYLVEECEVEYSEITDETSIIEELSGDSLMYVELVELLKKKYSLSIKIQSIGKFLLKNPANTVGEVINISYLIYEKENELVESE